jgi:DUF2075 family protein
MIVRGGPGTGKSVLAINLLVELNNRNMTCFYVTKNAAPRTVYATKLRGEYTTTYINHLFQSSGGFIDEQRNVLDCLVVDEAHRLNEKSGLFQNKGENQIKEIINAAKFSIFFIDENQKVTLKDIGSEDLIKKFAQEAGAGIYTYELDSQFRCNGSDGYVAWLDHMLEIRDTANFDIDGFDYDFKVVDTPNELRDIIEEKNRKNNKSRLVAGFCWEWPKEGRNNPDYNDILIDDKENNIHFEMSWNLDGGELFVLGEDTVKQAGCIHTVQGLEFDYVGVIIGDDMRYENGHIITDASARAKSDKSLQGLSNLEREERLKIEDRIIKNTYKTLMTRGMKGCYVYCTNKNLADYLKNIKI